MIARVLATRCRVLAPLALAACSLLLVGCGERVPTTYGRREGQAATSLNGTRVLGDMFKAAGHRVRSRQYLTPSLEHADVIVWFPDDFEPPTAEVEQWLTDWLTYGDYDDPTRVLIYVGRDFDAAPDYWQKMQTQPPPGLKQEYARRLSEAQSEAAARQPAKLARPETDDWFKFDINPPQTTVKSLTGGWADGIDASQVEIERNARLVPLDNEYELLLGDANREPLVSEYHYLGYDESDPFGRLILIENGSWLLNARLVNHEHRKLAGRLVDSIGSDPRMVVFLQSEPGGPTIADSDPSSQPPMGLQMFRVWPIGAVLTQLAALGIVYALMKWPIFGTPNRLSRSSNTDFGSHVSALGRLLSYGRSRSHAINLLRLYRQAIRREAPPLAETATASASSHSPPPLTPPPE